VATAQFWLLANHVFNAREAKRLFGFLGTGAILGGIFGGYLTNVLAPIIHSHNLLLVGASFLVLSTYLVSVSVRKTVHIDYKARRKVKRPAPGQATSSSPVKLIRGSALLTSLLFLVILSVFTASLVDYQFNAFASEYIDDPNELAAFFGFWLSTLSVVSLCIQVFFTNKIIKIFGVLPALMVLPLGILLGTFALLIVPGVAAAILLKVSSGSLKNSVDKSGLELLIVPVPSGIKNRVKTFIDVFADNLATGLAGIMLIFFIYTLDFSPYSLSFVILILIVIQLIIITLKVRKEYTNSFRQAIEKRNVDFDLDLINIQDAKLLEELLAKIPEYNDKQVLFILNLIPAIKDEGTFSKIKGLIHHSNPSIRISALKLLGTFTQGDLRSDVNLLVNDTSQDVRVEAIKYICLRTEPKQKALQEFLYNTNHDIKSAALLCLAHEVKADPSENQTSELIQAFKGLQTIIQYSTKECRDLKIVLAKVIALAQLPETYPYLEPLFFDADINVQREAINSAGVVRHRPFASILINKLINRRTRKETREALTQYGEGIIPDLKTMIINDSVNIRVRKGLIKTLGAIPSQLSVDILLTFLSNETFPLVKDVLRALVSLGNRVTGIRFSRKIITKYVFREIVMFKTIRWMFTNQRFLLADQDSDTAEGLNSRVKKSRLLFIKAIEEKREQLLENIFKALGLLYGSHDMLQAYQGVKSRNESIRAQAIEFLDTILSIQLKREIIPIVEVYATTMEKTEGTVVDKSQKSDELETLQEALYGNDNWLRVCALYLLGLIMPSQGRDIIQGFAKHADKTTRETAQLILEGNVC
jgi:AAA family ATP:ADP antiporter